MDISTHFSTIVSSIKRIIEQKHYSIKEQLTHEPHKCVIITDLFTTYIFYQESDARVFVRIRANDNKNHSKYYYHADICPFSNNMDLILYELDCILPDQLQCSWIGSQCISICSSVIIYLCLCIFLLSLFSVLVIICMSLFQLAI